jgi:hypothetical protein
MYLEVDPGEISPSVPVATVTPEPESEGQLSLAVTFAEAGGAPRPFPARVRPDTTITITLEVVAVGDRPGQLQLSVLALEDGVGLLAPSRGSLSASGAWTVTLRVGSTLGSFPLLFVAQDFAGNYASASVLATVIVLRNEPVLIASGARLRPAADSHQLRAQHRSWWKAVTMRSWVNPDWFDSLCDDLYRDRSFLDAIAAATRIDRDRLEITHTMPPLESFTSYATMEPIMSRYWADTGITLSAVTANQIGNAFVAWRATPGLVITMSDDVAKVLRSTSPTVSVGGVLNAVGAAMVILDFWSNMAAAETPVEAKEAWSKAGYGSFDLYLSNLVANTFGAATALPGMFTSYLLMSSFDTLIGDYEACWFKRAVAQAVDAGWLSDDLGDTVAVSKVMAAMKSPGGLEGALTVWWADEAPTWAGKMGGCGNWDLGEARGYRKKFVDAIMRSAEVEVNGARYHPWSFYYSVSRKLVLERRKELARDIAGKLRELEGAYISSLRQKRYRGMFRLVSSGNPDSPLADVVVRPTEWDDLAGWTTNQDGFFVAQVNGHLFSPDGMLLLSLESEPGSPRVFVVPRSAFVEVTP